MSGIQDIDNRTPIVEKDGTASVYLLRKLKGVTGPIGDAITDIATLFARNLTAGAGLAGGGDLTADRTFNVGAGAGITVNADDVQLEELSPTPAGTYGIPIITVDAYGRVIAATDGAEGSGSYIPLVDGSVPPVLICQPDGSLVLTVYP